MLDLTQIAQQMPGISQHLRQEAEFARHRLDRATRLMQIAQTRQDELVAQQQQWRDRLLFTAAMPVEPLDHYPEIAAAPAAHTVLATDGSQIAPNHHEIAYCYLINVGQIVLHYGQSRHPVLASVPEVFYRAEDLYVSRQWGIGTEEWMGHRRTVSEAIALAQLATQVHATVAAPPPTLALVDGSLIYWFLETMPEAARQELFPPILAAWETLRRAGIPLLGYVSASRSGEALNFLRLAQCAYGEPNCVSHCGDRADKPPCQTLEPLRDAAFWAQVLQPGQRSPLWRSAAPILAQYGDYHQIYFCYVHVGLEVARVEMPAWVAQAPAQLAMALSLVIAQVQKGFGYPVALAEAHNQAVVRGGDRTRFFALLEQEMIRAGLRNVGTSYKEARKRGSIA